jgi:hypothetical protein
LKYAAIAQKEIIAALVPAVSGSQNPNRRPFQFVHKKHRIIPVFFYGPTPWSVAHQAVLLTCFLAASGKCAPLLVIARQQDTNWSGHAFVLKSLYCPRESSLTTVAPSPISG